MYLRSTKRRNQDGTEVEYFQLAHNVCNPRTGKPLAQIIHNFGRADQVDRDSLVRLCRSIARVCGVAIQDAPPAVGETASRQSQASLPDYSASWNWGRCWPWKPSESGWALPRRSIRSSNSMAIGSITKGHSSP